MSSEHDKTDPTPHLRIGPGAVGLPSRDLKTIPDLFEPDSMSPQHTQEDLSPFVPEAHTRPIVSQLEGVTLKGCYYIEKKLGKGGMAWVYRAFHTAFQGPVAIKFLFEEQVADSRVYERFLREAQLQFSMKHPNIVSVLDYIDEQGVVGCVLEWIEGSDLKVWLQQNPGPVPPLALWRLFGPIVEAISYAHEKDVVHRDIKPANILLEQGKTKLTPKVADFGIAKVLGMVTRLSSAQQSPMGSLHYVSPEQINDSSRVDHRTDIYSLGILLYRMATGKLPFEGDAHNLIFQQLREPPPPPREVHPELSPALESVILKCMEKDRDLRPQSCDELLLMLTHVFGTPTVSASFDNLPSFQPELPALVTMDVYDDTLEDEEKLAEASRQLKAARNSPQAHQSSSSRPQAWVQPVLIFLLCIMFGAIVYLLKNR